MKKPTEKFEAGSFFEQVAKLQKSWSYNKTKTHTLNEDGSS